MTPLYPSQVGVMDELAKLTRDWDDILTARDGRTSNRRFAAMAVAFVNAHRESIGRAIYALRAALATADKPLTGRDYLNELVHLGHCNFGEWPGQCKYGPAAECPALTEWGWLPAAYAATPTAPALDVPEFAAILNALTFGRVFPGDERTVRDLAVFQMTVGYIKRLALSLAGSASDPATWCGFCHHRRDSHTNGGTCYGNGSTCYCVRFPDAPDFALSAEQAAALSPTTQTGGTE